jgi:hypothetical protein
MTLRAMLREYQRQTNSHHPIRPAGAAEQNRHHHLHLIRRDGRGGLFLPYASCTEALVEPSEQRGNQKGSAA